MGDWLGTGKVANRFRQHRPFEEARSFVQALGFRSGAEWKAYCRSGNKPDDIPTNPSRTYADDGWQGMGDWLGTDTVANRYRQFRPFKKAQAFVHRLGLNSNAEWRDYCKSGEKPEDIPAVPEQTYANEGWAGYGDWLGTDQVATKLRPYRSFREARSFVRNLGLKSNREWRDYCKSGTKPDDIPANPNRTYAKKGWAGWRDWLGTI